MKKVEVIFSKQEKFLKKGKKAIQIILLFTLLPNISCKTVSTNVKNSDPPDVAIAWMKLQHRLFVGTPGTFPHVSGRAYAYAGFTLYESIVPGMSDHQSVVPQLTSGLTLPNIKEGEKYFWPAAANAALAFMYRNLFPHTSSALLKAIDSLETGFYDKFLINVDAEEVQRSSDFGRQIADAIFEWSKTDGGHEAYKSPFSETYVAPTEPGNWVPTDTIFMEPIYPDWGKNRTFIPGIADITQPSPPPAYSEDPNSAFYNAVHEIYAMSQNLTRNDSLTAKFWAYEPINNEGEKAKYEDASHAVNIATQMVVLKELSLQEAAVLYCKHGISGNEAGTSCVKTKFKYNVVRPVTYIRTVLGHSDWNTVIFTPPFPEYTSGHAAVSMAYATVLENVFGKNFAFTDHTFDDSYGSRHFNSFDAYAKEAALSRLYGGIHYRFSMDEGLKQGKKVGEIVNSLKFKR